MIDSAPFIQQIKLLSKQRGLTQAALAEKAGLPRSQLSRLLSGKSKQVQQATVDKMVAAFGLTQKEFLAKPDDENLGNLSKQPPKTVYSDRLPTVAGKFIGRTAELNTLDDAQANPDVNILEFIAPGGAGKTKLLRHWLNTRRNAMTSMIAWSFYSQGAAADKQISTSPFFDHALQILDAEQKTFSSDEDKGDYLAELLRDKQCVLVLDGLEPLQYADAANRGELKDRALVRLLKNLAGQSGAFCVITTRIAVYELSDRTSVISYNLENLTIDDSVTLLRSLGVHGKKAALLKAVNDYAGHALALSLLGNLLRLRYRGDIDRLDVLPDLLQEGVDKTSRHAFKVMQDYQEWFAGTPELSLLYLLGLFDRPVELEVFEALWEAQITGLTDIIQEAEWFSAIDSLRHDHHILTDSNGSEEAGGSSQVLDCHPLIREYFGGQLKQTNAEAWQAAHECLYEYYKAVPEKELPDTLEEIRPLFYAVKHGCEAGLYQQVFDDVYWPRISRNDEKYLASKLGAFSDDLDVISNFFSRQWAVLQRDIPNAYEDLLISLVTDCLLALLTRAHLSREISDFKKAHQDLQEVYDIAHPSGMRLYLTDYHLEMARLLLKQWQQQLLDDTAQADIQSHISAAVKLIDETGYHRRDAEVEALIGPSQITPDKQKTWSEEW